MPPRNTIVIILHFIEKETKRKKKQNKTKQKKKTRASMKGVSTIPLLGRLDCIDVTVNISIKSSNALKILHR